MTEFLNNTLVQRTARQLELTAERANADVMKRGGVRMRGIKGKALSEMVAYGHHKRSVSNFFEKLGKTTVKAYVASIEEHKDMGNMVPV